MDWWLAAAVGALGAAAAEAAELSAFIKQQGRIPWTSRASRAEREADRDGPPWSDYLLAISLKVFIATSLVGSYAGSGQVSGSLGAFTLGAGASVIMARIANLKAIGDQPGPIELPPMIDLGESTQPEAAKEPADD